MPGLISPLSASGTGAIAGMKRPYEDVSVPTCGQPHPKKRKVVHQLRYRQPVSHFAEPLGGGFGATDDHESIDTQMRRAIALQCGVVGFASAKPEAVQAMAGLVHEFMTNFTDQLRKSMTTARRTTALPHDYIYALNSVGLAGSGVLESHLDTGGVPLSVLQPTFAPPEPAEPPPPELEGMLGPELSGRADKENKKYIPTHFPAFPPKHTWKSTPVYAEREADPHAIREKAAKEGIEAERSLRKLMDKKKDGERISKANRAEPKRSAIAEKRELLWKTALREALEEEEAEEARKLDDARDRAAVAENPTEADLALMEDAREAKNEAQQAEEDEYRDARKEWIMKEAEASKKGIMFDCPTEEEWRAAYRSRNTPEQKRERRIEQCVTVNYGRQFWRRNARS